MFTMICKRGDVVLVLFPDSNLLTAKARPALVVQADLLNTGVNQVIVAMITTNLARANHPSRVLISVTTLAGRQTGLHADSVIVTDNLTTIIESKFGRVIGVWPDMSAVDAALRHTLAL
jgi:mRNA interferase MazF